jgi:hypothetical protein
MKYFDYLRNIFPLYLISGIVLGLILFSLIIIHRYNNYLTDILDVIKNTTLTKEHIRNQINKIDAVIKYIKDDLGLDVITDAYSERLIFQALDDIKTNLKDASITVTSFEEIEGGKRLPVEISASMKNYRMVIDYVNYIESFRIPKYKINYISISKEQTGTIALNIKGALIMPSLGEISYIQRR